MLKRFAQYQYLLIISLLFSWPTVYAQEELRRIDSLKTELSATSVDTTQLFLLKKISRAYLFINGDSAVHYAMEAERKAYSLDQKLEIARTIQYVGTGYWVLSEFDSAASRYKQALELFLQLEDDDGIIACYTNLAIIYSNQGKNNLALEHYQKSSNYFRSNPEDSLYDWLSYHYNVGVVYIDLELYEDALRSYEQVLKIAENNTDYSRYENGAYLNMATIYLNTQNYDTARLTIQTIIDAGKTRGDQSLLGSGYFQMGHLEYDLKNYPEAIENLEKSAAIEEARGSQRELARTYIKLTQAYLARYRESENASDLELARGFNLQAIELTKDIGADPILATGYQLQSDIAVAQNDFRTAFEASQNYHMLNDSLQSAEKLKQFSEMKERFESEQKQNIIDLQEAQLSQKDLLLARQSLMRNVLILGLLFVVIIGAVIYRSERIKTKKNRQIESLLREIHHRVKNNLQVISSLLNMQSRGLEEEGVLEAIKEGQSRVKAMSLIHQKLYQTEQVSEIDFELYTKELLDQLGSLYKKNGLEVHNEVNARVKLDIDTAIPLGLMLNELISNAYKYAFEGMEKGKIAIDLKRISDSQLELQVSDTGNGLPPEIDLQKAKSMGLKLVNILTKQLKGQLTYSSEQGARFLIRFSDLKMTV